MIQVQFKLPLWMVREIDRLVREGYYPNRSAFVRHAIRELLRKERVYPFTNRGGPK